MPEAKKEAKSQIEQEEEGPERPQGQVPVSASNRGCRNGHESLEEVASQPLRDVRNYIRWRPVCSVHSWFSKDLGVADRVKV